MATGSKLRLTLSLLFAMGCSGEPCEDAAEKLDKCMRDPVASVQLPLHFEGECRGDQDECLAECVNEASCPAIRFVVIGGDRDPNVALPEDADDFEDCVRACVS